MNPAESGKTVLGRSVTIRGEFTGAEDLIIEGNFEGTVRNPGASVTIGPHARVRANIGAKDVLIYGRVEGQIYATGAVSMRGDAAVQGDVFSPRFSIEESALLQGRVDPTRAGDPLPAGPVAASRVAGPHAVPQLLVLEAPEPIAVQPPLFITPPSGPSGGASGNSGNLPAGLAAAWRKLDAGAGDGEDGDGMASLHETEDRNF